MLSKKSVVGKYAIEFCKVENLADGIDVYLTWDKAKSKVVTTKDRTADFENEGFEKNITADKIKSILVLPTPTKIKVFQKNDDAKAKDMLIGAITLDYTLFTGMKNRLFNFKIAINVINHSPLTNILLSDHCYCFCFFLQAFGILYPMLLLRITCDWSLGEKTGNWKKVDPEAPIFPEKKHHKEDRDEERIEEKKKKKNKKRNDICSEVDDSSSSPTAGPSGSSADNNVNYPEHEVRLLGKQEKEDKEEEDRQEQNEEKERDESKEKKKDKEGKKKRKKSDEMKDKDKDNEKEVSEKEEEEEEEEEESDNSSDSSDSDVKSDQMDSSEYSSEGSSEEDESDSSSDEQHNKEDERKN